MGKPYYPGQSVEIDTFIMVLPTKLAKKADEGATSITVYDASRWTDGITIMLGLNDPQMGASEIVTIGTVTVATGVCTLTTPLKRAYLVDTDVARLAESTLTPILRTPAGAESDPGQSNVSTGRKRSSFVPTLDGRYVYEGNTAGAVISAGAIEIFVSRDEA